MEARNLAAVGLSLLLAANCFMPCYTLAYADESQGVEDVSQEEQEEIAGDAGGLEFSFGVGESNVDASYGGAAAEGHGSDDGTAEGAGEDTSADYGEVDSFVSGNISSLSDDFGGFGVAVDGNEVSSQFGVSTSDGDPPGIEEDSYSNGEKGILECLQDIVYLLGEIADYYRQGGSGISPLADINSVYDQLVYIKAEIGSLNSVSLGSPAASNRHKWIMPATGDVWNTAKGGLTWLLSEATWYLDGIYSTNSQIRRSASDSTTYLLNFQNWYKSAFGFGYGGTRVLNSESPGAWLEYIRENTNLTQMYLKAVAGDGVEYSAAAYLRNTRQDVGSIKSYLVANGGDGVPYPAASWLKSAVDELRSIDTYSGYIRTNTNLTQEKLSTVSSLTERAGNFLKAKADDGVEYSAASYLHTLAKNSSILLGYSKSKGSDGVEYSFTGFLNMIAERTRSSAISLSTLLDYEKANGSLVSDGFSDVLDKMDSLSFDASVDLSGIESRLDSIVLLLSGSGVLENAKDVLDAIFGDMGFDATEAASAAVGNAIQNAFPFCVPAVLKQMLGLLQADPAPPEFHFDFWGAPLDFGFSDWQGLADMTSWLSRIGFAVVLFANSRRFVYSGGVAGD